MRRLRSILPGLVGLGLAATILWQGGTKLEQEAEGQEQFAVVVDEPAPILSLRPEGFDEVPTWRALIQPVDERERVEISLDGQPVSAGGTPQSGELSFTLEGLTQELGWHFVEVSIDRRGGRRDFAVDPVLVGRFADPEQDEDERSCAATLNVSADFVSSLVEPLLRDRLLPVLRENEYMGPGTQISRAQLELRKDAIAFDIVLSGIHTLHVSGVVLAAITDERKLHVELVTLGAVEFTGELRDQAEHIGAGGGALVGGLIAGPLAPVGAAAGWYAANRFVSKKARELVQEQVEQGLAEIDGVELLPETIDLVRGDPRSRVGIGFCEHTGVRPFGLIAGLWVEPRAQLEPGAEPWDLNTTGPLVTGTGLTADPLGADEDVRVELGIDGVNALIYSWTASGLLADLIGEQRSLARANEELEAWTPLRLRSLEPTRPPTLAPGGGPEAGWAYGIGGLSVAVEGVEDEPWGEVQIAATGTMSPSWDPEAGEIGLSGSLDRLELTCIRAHEDGQHQLLQGCFSDVLEAAQVREKIDERLRPGATHMPSFALRELLSNELRLGLDALALSRPRDGVLRLSAALSPS